MSIQWAYSNWSELQNVLPQAASFLGVSVDDLHVVSTHVIPNNYMSTKWRDHAVKTKALDGMPFVSVHSLHNKKGFTPGYGLILYEARGEPDLRYVIYYTRNKDGWNVSFTIVPKGSLFRLKRHAIRSEKKSNNNEPPVLKEGLLEKIVNSTVGFLVNSKEIEHYGVRVKRGILLDGPPGNGKTMVCRWVQKLCTEEGISWGVVTASQIDKAYQDNQLAQLFNSWTVTFFDDIDISYLSRRSGNGKMACALLTAMDGMTNNTHVVRIFTTNERVDSLDSAFIRPGRIDCAFRLDTPDEALRTKLVQRWSPEILSNINCGHLIASTHEASFAELECIKTTLVMNKLTGDGTWNLGNAIAEFQDRKNAFKGKGRMGLGT